MNNNDNRLSTVVSNVNNLSIAIQNFARTIKTYSGYWNYICTTLAKYLLVFADFATIIRANDIISKRQIIFTDEMSIDFAHSIIQSTNIDAEIERYYFGDNGNNVNNIIMRCKESDKMLPFSELYSQIIVAYNQNSYHLSCIGLFSIVDSLFSEESGMITETRYKLRMKKIKEKIDAQFELDELDRKTICIYQALDSFEDSLFSNSHFDKSEPDNLNRHWVMHGRTRRTYTRYDFLKVLLWLDALLFLLEQDKNCQSVIKEEE